MSRFTVVRRVLRAPKVCHTCGAPIGIGELYLDRRSGSRSACSDCAPRFGIPVLRHASDRTPAQEVARRITHEPAPADVAHLGDGTCWVWKQALGQTTGYGKGKGGHSSAHRWAYTVLVGPIPPGLHLDHLCKRRACVAPHHLEPVTAKENARRARPEYLAAQARRRLTHCKRGHEFTPENTIRQATGRKCRTCARATSLAYWRRCRDEQRAG